MRGNRRGIAKPPARISDVFSDQIMTSITAISGVLRNPSVARRGSTYSYQERKENGSANKKHIFTNRPVVTRAYAQEQLVKTVKKRKIAVDSLCLAVARKQPWIGEDCLWKVDNWEGKVPDTTMATQASPDARSGGQVSEASEIDEIPDTMLAVQVVEVSTWYCGIDYPTGGMKALPSLKRLVTMSKLLARSAVIYWSTSIFGIRHSSSHCPFRLWTIKTSYGM